VPRPVSTHELLVPPVCILAGGLGTRLGERARRIPKPLIDVAGEPFLMHQLRLLAEDGVSEVVLCVGHRGELIKSCIGSERFGIRVRYSFDAPGLDGTLGAVRRARSLLGERFLILYGDAYLRIGYGAVARAWSESGMPAVMTVLRNDGRWDASNAIYRDGLVVAYDKHAPSSEMSWIDYGLGGIVSAALDRIPESERDLAALYKALAQANELLGFEASERFYEIGTPAALAEADTFLRRAAARCAGSEA
jgi:NDP-sugar pyrophosphorylase family protein